VEGAPGHGCGHKRRARAAAAAIAVKQAIDKFGIKGTIKVFGSRGRNRDQPPYMVGPGSFRTSMR